MKRLLFCSILLFSMTTLAQRIEKKTVAFTYNQYPKTCLKDNRAIKYTLINGYLDKIEQKRQQYIQDTMLAHQNYIIACSNYANDTLAANQEYQAALVQFAKEQIKIDAQYARELALYYASGKAEGKPAPVKPVLYPPTKRSVTPPVKTTIREPRYQTIQNTDQLVNLLLVEGLEKDGINPMQCIATLKGFEVVSAKITEKVKTTKNDQGEEVKSYEYRVQTKYKHPISYQVFSPQGAVMDEKTFGNNTLSYTSSIFKNRDQAQKHLDDGDYLSPLEQKIIPMNIKAINKHLSDEIGYRKIATSTTVRLFKHRKMTYPEYAASYEFLLSALPRLQNEEEYNQALPFFEKAVEQYSNALRESDPNNNKARINKKVSKATHLMLAECYLWMNDFMNAEIQLNKCKVLKPIAWEKRKHQSLTNLLASQRQRVNAFKLANQ